MTTTWKRTCSALLAAVLLLAMALPAFAARPKSVSLNRSSLTLLVGDSPYQLRATIRPADADEQTDLTWRVSNQDVASVSDDGLVTPLESGTTYISVRTENGKGDSCLLTVRDPDAKIRVRAVELSMSNITVRVDQTRTLWADVIPSDASDVEIDWSSDNPDVATVDDDGTVTGVAPGKTTVTARAGSRSATCTVTVPEYVGGLTTQVKPEKARTNSGVYLTAAEARTAARDTARSVRKNETGYVRFNNKPTASTEVISAVAYEAESAGRNLRLRFATTDSNNNVQGMITFDPQQATSRSSDFATGVSPVSQRAQATQKLFQKHYANRLSAIDFSQNGKFGFSATVAVKVPDLSKAEASSLHFYSYDAADNVYNRITASNVAFDSNGYLHFSTSSGGLIVVSEGALAK